MTESYIETGPHGTMFAGPDAVALYRATALASALHLYARSRLRVNRAYTPSAMMRAAADITGRTFRARDYEGAATALLEWKAAAQKRVPVFVTDAKSAGAAEVRVMPDGRVGFCGRSGPLAEPLEHDDGAGEG